MIAEIFIFAIALGAIFLIVSIYKREEATEIRVTQKRESVSVTFDEMGTEEKDYVNGSAVIREITSLPEGTYVKVNSTVVSEKKGPTGEKYITYSKKYGTKLLEREVSINNSYKREAVLDADGNITGVTYTTVYLPGGTP